jgi:hypothetical protein
MTSLQALPSMATIKTVPEFYSTSYGSTNKKTVGAFEEKPFVIPSQRPTGYSSNFRPVFGYSPRSLILGQPHIQP